MRHALSLITLAALGCGGATAACPEPPPTPEATASPPAEVRALASAERRASPPGTATVAFLARGRNAFLARLEMEPGGEVPEHQDADEEYVHVLEGHGTMWIDGVEHAVTPGATIFMPAGATVRYVNGEQRMIALQVFAGPGSAAKYDRWTPLLAD